MQAAFSDSTGTIAASGARAPGARQLQFLRNSGLNILRFGSILIGAGLLLRVGASEQASSALSEEKAPAQKPVRVRITLPEPAFSQPAKHESVARSSSSLAAIAAAEKAAGVSAQAPRISATLEPVRIDAPTPAFAAAFVAIPHSAPDAVPDAVKLQSGKHPADRAAGLRAQPASVPEAGEVAMAPAPLAVAPHAPPPRAALAAAMPLGSRQSVAEGLLAPIRAASPSTGLRAPMPAAPAPTPIAIAAAPARPALAATPSSLVRPSLAATPSPVVRVAEPVKPPVVAAAAKPAAGLPQPARIVSTQNLASAQPRPTAPAAASAVQATSRPMLAAKPIVTGPLGAAPVRISLAPPVMRPGPRTTVITSNLGDEMRRPASAWDYAEALPPELSGSAAAAARRSTSSEPAAMPPPAFGRPLPVEAASAAPRKAAASAGVQDKSAALSPPAAPAANAKRVAILDTGRVPDRRALSNVAPSTGAGKRIVRRVEDRAAMDPADAASDAGSADARSAGDGAGEGKALSLRDSIPHPAF